MCTYLFFVGFFFISWGKTSGGSSCAMWASVSWACWARHSEGHYSTGRLALAMALQSCHKGFSVRHLTQQAHSYVCRGFPWKLCKLWCWQTEAKVILLWRPFCILFKCFRAAIFLNWYSEPGQQFVQIFGLVFCFSSFFSPPCLSHGCTEEVRWDAKIIMKMWFSLSFFFFFF